MIDTLIDVLDAVEIDGLRLAFERSGTGPPVVLAHGYVGDGPSTWRRQLDELSDEFTVVAWDAPGAGGSSDPPEGFSMANYSDCLARFIGALKLTNPHVVGLSFGGAMVIDLCSRHHGLAATATLVGAYAGWAGSLPPEEVDRRLQQALELADLSPAELVDTLLPTMFADSAPADIVDMFRVALMAFHPVGFRAMARASAEDLRAAVSTIDVPTLLIYGTNDVRAPLKVADHLHRSIQESELLLLDNAGHLCNVDAASEFNSAVREFFHRHGNT